MQMSSHLFKHIAGKTRLIVLVTKLLIVVLANLFVQNMFADVFSVVSKVMNR